jgi:hypothetical protein
MDILMKIQFHGIFCFFFVIVAADLTQIIPFQDASGHGSFYPCVQLAPQLHSIDSHENIRTILEDEFHGYI